MKKNIFITLFAATAAMLMASCTKEAPAVKIDFDVDANVTVDAKTGIGTVNVVSLSTWTASCDASWVKLTNTTGKNCGTIGIQAEPNTSSLLSRTATVTVTCDGVSKTATLTQKSIQISTIALAKGQTERISFKAQDVKLALNVTSNVKYNFATSDPARIRVNDDKKGNITVSVDTNKTTDLRDFYIVYSSDVKIGQKKDPKDTTKTIDVFQSDTLKFKQEFQQYFKLTKAQFANAGKAAVAYNPKADNLFFAEGGTFSVDLSAFEVKWRVYCPTLRKEYYGPQNGGWISTLDFDVPKNETCDNLVFDIIAEANMTALNEEESKTSNLVTYTFVQAFKDSLSANILNKDEAIDADFIVNDKAGKDVAFSNKKAEYKITFTTDAILDVAADGAEIEETETPNLYILKVDANKKEKVAEIELTVKTNVIKGVDAKGAIEYKEFKTIFKQAKADPAPTK